MLSREVCAIRSKYVPTFRYANVMPLDRLPSKIKFRNYGSLDFSNLMNRARNLGVIPDQLPFGSNVPNETLYRMKKMGIDILQTRLKDGKNNRSIFDLFRLSYRDYKWLGIIKTDKLVRQLEQNGIPNWLRLRSGEARTVENAARAIIGRLGEHGDVLEVYNEESFLREAAKVDNLFKGDYVAFAAEILFGLDTNDFLDINKSDDHIRNLDISERSKITNESQKNNFFIRALQALCLPDNFDSQFNLLDSIIKRLLLHKDLDPAELADSRDSLFISIVAELYAENILKRELLLKKFIDKYYPGADNMLPQVRFLFLRLDLGEENQIKFVSRMADLLYSDDELSKHRFFIHAKDCLPSGIIHHAVRDSDALFSGDRGAEILLRIARFRHNDHREQENFIIRLALTLDTLHEKRWLIGNCSKLLHKSSNAESIDRFLNKSAKALFVDVERQDEFVNAIKNSYLANPPQAPEN